MPSTCGCPGKGFEFCVCSTRAATEAAQRIAELEREVERLKRAEALLVDALRSAEWRDKNIYPCCGAAYQNWKLDIYLPVPLSSTNKSPEAALQRALKIARRAA